MKHIFSNHIGDFAEIYSDAVELVSVRRPNAARLNELGEALIASRNSVEVRWEQPMESDQSILNDLEPKLGTELKEALQCELAEVSEVLQKLLECDRLGIRLATLRGPMCPKFHVDQVPCRMLMTISGRGTEWIANPEVDPVLMADRHNQEPPLRTGGEVRHIGSGEWSLLKGGTWEEQFNGVVHRSPHGQGQRLFMSIDPVFSDAA